MLMTMDGLGRPRVESARRRLAQLNPNVVIVTVGENMNDHPRRHTLAGCRMHGLQGLLNGPSNHGIAGAFYR